MIFVFFPFSGRCFYFLSFFSRLVFLFFYPFFLADFFCYFLSFFLGWCFLVFSVLCRIGFPGWCARLGSDMPRLCPDSSKNQMIEMENLNKEKERLNGKYDLFIGFDEHDLESL